MAVVKVKCENQIILESSHSKPIVCLFFFKIVISKKIHFFVMKTKSCGAARHLQLQHALEYVCFDPVLLCTIN